MRTETDYSLGYYLTTKVDTLGLKTYNITSSGSATPF